MTIDIFTCRAQEKIRHAATECQRATKRLATHFQRKKLEKTIRNTFSIIR